MFGKNKNKQPYTHCLVTLVVTEEGKTSKIVTMFDDRIIKVDFDLINDGINAALEKSKTIDSVDSVLMKFEAKASPVKAYDRVYFKNQ